MVDMRDEAITMLNRTTDFEAAGHSSTPAEALREFLKSCSRGGLRNAEMVLRKHPCFIHAFDSLLTYPFHVAAANGHIALCGFLLAKGADPMSLDIDGNTALHYAARNGRSETIEHLVQQKFLEVDVRNYVSLPFPASVGSACGHYSHKR